MEFVVLLYKIKYYIPKIPKSIENENVDLKMKFNLCFFATLFHFPDFSAKFIYIS
jgi:hypothetical protein